MAGRPGITIPDDIGEHSACDLAINASVPLVDTVTARKRTAAARHDLARRRLDIEEEKRKIALAVEKAFLDHQSAVEALDVSRKQLENTKKNHESAGERYRLGVSSFYELSEAETSLVKAEMEAIKAFYGLRMARAELAYECGVEIPLD